MENFNSELFSLEIDLRFTDQRILILQHQEKLWGATLASHKEAGLPASNKERREAFEALDFYHLQLVGALDDRIELLQKRRAIK